MNFLKLIEGKEQLLHQLALKDIQQRLLVAETKAAIVDLGGIKNRINRRVLQEIVERCMFLLYWAVRHPKVAIEISWEALTQKATNHILDTEITTDVLRRSNVYAMILGCATSLHLAVLQVVGEWHDI